MQGSGFGVLNLVSGRSVGRVYLASCIRVVGGAVSLGSCIRVGGRAALPPCSQAPLPLAPV